MRPAIDPLHPIVAAYVRATNRHDRTELLACFAPEAVVDDAGRTWRGSAGIGEWGEREIFAPRVALFPLRVAVEGDVLVLTTRVEGDFDRTGLPDPVVVEHRMLLAGDRIARLACGLAPDPTASRPS